MIDITVESTNKTSPKVMLTTNANGMVIFLSQENDAVEMTIDQATKIAVEILTHCQEMANKHLNK